jgi:hypothetical protein
MKIPCSAHDPHERQLTNAMGFKVKSATKGQRMSFKMAQKLQQYSILNSHLTLSIYLLTLQASCT